jgi:hypothetical protein
MKGKTHDNEDEKVIPLPPMHHALQGEMVNI